MIAINVNQWISTRLIFLASVFMLATSSAQADEFQVTVAGTLVLSEFSQGVDVYNLDGADFELVFVYDTDAQQRTGLNNSVFASSTFDFVEAAYSFSNRPNGAADATASFGHNMSMRNAYDSSTIDDGFSFPQGGFDSSSEFDGLRSNNGAGLSFGNNTYFSGNEPVQRMPAITSDDIESVRVVTYVFSSSEHGFLYNYENANLVSIVPVGVKTAITHVPLYTFDGGARNDTFGLSVSGAGDVNGDGSADLIVGAPGFNDGFTNGYARVLSGSDGSVLYTFTGDSVADHIGVSVSGAGDVDGDGFADLIIGAPWDDNNGTQSGNARVLSGSDGSVLYNFDGDSADFFGDSVSGAGDVNGDGTPDLIVGAPSYLNNGTTIGYARVLSGSDGSVLFNFDGDDVNDRFGSSVSGAGDVNGDGRDDLIVGAYGDDNNGSISGSARVLSGSDGSVLYNFDGDSSSDIFGWSVSSAGDVNSDGRDDLLVGAPDSFVNGSNISYARVLSGSNGSVLYTFNGDSPHDDFGWSVSSAGDVNGDGIADIIVGAPGDDNIIGYARVLSGSDGSILYNFNGGNVDDRFGRSVSGVGDVNGDGIDDFIVGASRGGANGAGYARVFVSQIILLGDCNLDGVVNFLDIGPFISILSAADYLAEADIDRNGVVDFLDIQHFIALLSS